ncbi:CAP domain-containing protein [Salinicoccus albus]|uniref:CAP domain-containing protein n=1 Tax=Salinicoccus albus TaxID=418756 RepID=UPI000368E8A1|nr:CAP domain-containing protein [Salinicoccus albus]
MLRRAFTIVFLYILAMFAAPMIQSYDFENGWNAQYAQNWLQTHVYPNYDRSMIQQVNSTQTQDVEITMDEAADSEDEEVIDSEYVGDFVVNDAPGLFHLTLVDEGRVAGAYTNSDDVSINDINIENLDREKVREVYGEPQDFIIKGWKRLRVDSEHFEVFDLQENYVYFFYDTHKNDKVNGMLLLDKEQVTNIDTLYNNPEAADSSRLNHLMVNASRIEYGLKPLAHDENASAAARGHSRDMAQNNYFDHNSPDGETLKDRIEETDVTYRMAGENIAMGHTSPIFSHHSLMNSPDHRVNLLHESFTHLGTGTAFGDDDTPYYTENFIKK